MSSDASACSQDAAMKRFPPHIQLWPESFYLSPCHSMTPLSCVTSVVICPGIPVICWSLGSRHGRFPPHMSLVLSPCQALLTMTPQDTPVTLSHCDGLPGTSGSDTSAGMQPPTSYTSHVSPCQASLVCDTP